MSAAVSIQPRVQKFAGTIQAKKDNDVVSSVSDGIRIAKVTNQAGVLAKGTN